MIALHHQSRFSGEYLMRGALITNCMFCSCRPGDSYRMSQMQTSTDRAKMDSEVSHCFAYRQVLYVIMQIRTEQFER